nr:YpiB family protein [Neobacillus sp. Marseille-Q6967]
MKKWVSPVEKSNFLKWFIEHHQLKRKDARKLVEYIIQHFHLLENVSFTEKIKLGEKTIVFSSINSDEPGFVFYNGQRKTEDVSKALGELMMNPADKINIILHFNGSRLNYRYLQLIDNHVSSDMKQYEQFQRDAKEVDHLIEKMTIEQRIENVKNQIDAALDQKNKALFTELTNELNKLIAVSKT